MTKVFSNIPSFRILIPFVIGILLSIQFSLSPVNFLVFPALLIITSAFWFKKQQTSFTKKAFLMCMDVFLFLFAITLVHNTNLVNRSAYYGNYLNKDSATCIIATINDITTEKERFIKCQLKVNEIKAGKDYVNADGNIIAYFKKPVIENDLQPGTTLILKTKLIEIDPPQNPFEFNYRNYLFNKQIYHTAFIDNGTYDRLDVPVQLNTIWYHGLLVKKFILQKLKNSRLSANAYGICAALLTGYDDEIDKQVVQSFSHSGTLHVLSVSGLHTGLIYLVLSFLFDLIDRKHKYKLLKFFLITVLLWSFALITGFSAPVLRAVIMFNLLGFGKIFFRSDHRNQVNILLVSAFILLCYDPFFITDVGFLLSYFAMFGLLYFQPKLVVLWQTDNKVANWLWQGTTASFAATISTLPLTLFYFKQFPLWFFVCNIVVVPASFIVLLLALLIVLKAGFVAVIINYLVHLLITFITLFNSSKFGFIDSIDFNFYDALFLSFLIISITIALQNRSYRLISLSLVMLIVWQISALFSSYDIKTQDHLTVYQINKDHALTVKNKSNTTLNVLDSSQFMYHVKPHITSFNNSELNTKAFNYIRSGKKNILVLNKKDHWPLISLQNIEFLVLANNFKLIQKDLQAFANLKTIVVDGSNNNYSIKKAEELCRKFGIALIKTKQTGAYTLNL